MGAWMFMRIIDARLFNECRIYSHRCRWRRNWRSFSHPGLGNQGFLVIMLLTGLRLPMRFPMVWAKSCRSVMEIMYLRRKELRILARSPSQPIKFKDILSMEPDWGCRYCIWRRRFT